MTSPSYLIPKWPAPGNIRAAVTTRQGGYSHEPYTSFNLGTHVEDDLNTVQANRTYLKTLLQLPSEPYWLAQIHSNKVIALDDSAYNSLALPQVDGSWTATENKVCVVLTADCIPVLLCDQHGTTVAALHAGWPGLAAGILENGVHALPVPPQELIAWLGPGISGAVYEVGEEVRQAFLAQDANAQNAFRPAARKQHWYADLYLIARQRLQAAGVTAIYGGEYCSYSDHELFFSYRRDGKTGRMASLIWRV